MQLLSSPESQQNLAEALCKMNRALAILDEEGIPGEVGSHLDLAIRRLEVAMGIDSKGGTEVHALVAELEHEFIAPSPALATSDVWD